MYTAYYMQKGGRGPDSMYHCVRTKWKVPKFVFFSFIQFIDKINQRSHLDTFNTGGMKRNHPQMRHAGTIWLSVSTRSMLIVSCLLNIPYIISCRSQSDKHILYESDSVNGN